MFRRLDGHLVALLIVFVLACAALWYVNASLPQSPPVNETEAVLTEDELMILLCASIKNTADINTLFGGDSDDKITEFLEEYCNTSLSTFQGRVV